MVLFLLKYICLLLHLSYSCRNAMGCILSVTFAPQRQECLTEEVRRERHYLDQGLRQVSV